MMSERIHFGCPPSNAVTFARSDVIERRPVDQFHGIEMGAIHFAGRVDGTILVDRLARVSSRRRYQGFATAVRPRRAGRPSTFPSRAEAAARLHHTNIVPSYSTGEMDGTHFYAME